MPFRAGPATFLTVSEVAARWKVRPESVTRHHIKVGGLPAQHLGRMVVVSIDDLRTYEERLRKHLLGKRKAIEAWIKRLDAPIQAAAQ